MCEIKNGGSKKNVIINLQQESYWRLVCFKLHC